MEHDTAAVCVFQYNYYWASASFVQISALILRGNSVSRALLRASPTDPGSSRISIEHGPARELISECSVDKAVSCQQLLPIKHGRYDRDLEVAF